MLRNVRACFWRKEEARHQWVDDCGLETVEVLIQLEQIGDRIAIIERECPVLDTDLNVKEQRHYQISWLIELEHSDFPNDSTLITSAPYKASSESERSRAVVKTK